MEAKSIADVPNEVIEKLIMVHLWSNDVRSFGSIGIKRIKQITTGNNKQKSFTCLQRGSFIRAWGKPGPSCSTVRDFL